MTSYLTSNDLRWPRKYQNVNQVKISCRLSPIFVVFLKITNLVQLDDVIAPPHISLTSTKFLNNTLQPLPSLLQKTELKNLNFKTVLNAPQILTWLKKNLFILFILVVAMIFFEKITTENSDNRPTKSPTRPDPTQHSKIFFSDFRPDPTSKTGGRCRP